MFSTYIKTKRTEHKITQNQLVTKLKIFAPKDYYSLDNVTLSRWERGITIPSRHKKILVVRFFKEGLIPFLLSQEIEADHVALKKFHHIRFTSAFTLHSQSSYELKAFTKSQIINLSAVENVNYYMNKIDKIHQNLNVPDSNLFNQNLLSLLQEKRADARIHLQDNKMTGHSLSFFFSYDEFLQQLAKNKCSLDYTQSISSEKNSEMVMYNASRFFNDPALHTLNIYREVLSMVNNKNIQYFALKVINNESYKYHSSHGFSVIACENEAPSGEFMIGGKRYRQAIMMADVAKLLASDHAIAIFQHYYPMSNDQERLENCII